MWKWVEFFSCVSLNSLQGASTLLFKIKKKETVIFFHERRYRDFPKESLSKATIDNFKLFTKRHPGPTIRSLGPKIRTFSDAKDTGPRKHCRKRKTY